MRILKKYSTVLLLCFWAAFVGGCAKERTEYGPCEMRFGVSSVERTRGNAILSVDEITSIGVFGYTTGMAEITGPGSWTYPADLLDNQKVSRSGMDWIYNPVAYWPAEGINNTFFAYSPHSSEFAVDSYVQALVPDGGGAPTLRYSIPANVVDHKDILVAKGVYNVDLASPGVNNGMVRYEMGHAMTWLALVLNPTDIAETANETYTVDWLAFKADNLPVASYLNLETGTWASPITHGDVSWELMLDTDLSRNITPDRATRLTDDNNRIMLLPFDLQADMVNIDLTYYYNPNGDSYDEANGNYIGNEYSYSLPIPETSMRPGIVVVYLINISPEGAYVEFRQENWDDNWIEEWISYGTTIGEGDDDDDWIQVF